MLNVQVDLNLGFLESLPDRLEAALQDVLDGVLFEMEAVAKQVAPSDTGFLRSSIFVVTSRVAALPGPSISGKAGFHAGGAAAWAHPSNPFEGWLVAGAEYAIYVEYGHFARRGPNSDLEKLDQRFSQDRGGRVVVDAPGGMVTFVPGYLFFAEAAAWGRTRLPVAAAEAIRGILGA